MCESDVARRYSGYSSYRYTDILALVQDGTSFFLIFFFFNDTATTEIYTLSLHDALPISANFSPMVVLPTPEKPIR